MVIAKTVGFLQSILSTVNADDCELVLEKSDASLTRFAGNRIHQSTQTDTRNLRIRVVVNGCAGAYDIDRFDQDSVAMAVQRAVAIAQVQQRAPRPVSLPAQRPIADSTAVFDSTARAQAFDRAQVIREIVDLATTRGVQASGAVSTSEETLCVVNSRGTESYQQHTVAELNLVASRGGLSGYSYWVGSDFAAMPHRALAAEAVEMAACPLPEVVVEPGPMTVVLDHYAAGMMVAYLAHMGFGAKQVIEGRSFMAEKMGSRICAAKVSIWDDGRDRSGLPRLFDYEGVARRRVMLVDRGIAAGVVTDSATAPLMESDNTGHALPMPNSDGPAAANLFVAPGRTPLARIIAGVERGIYVRKFHYVNAVDPMAAVITGMTKDGTFLIENGGLTSPVRNLRFTQGILKALRNVAQISSETKLVEGRYGPVMCPAMLIRGFNFTGVSDQ
jgi:predicted Zn-dependent protease